MTKFKVRVLDSLTHKVYDTYFIEAKTKKAAELHACDLFVEHSDGEYEYSDVYGSAILVSSFTKKQQGDALDIKKETGVWN